jgi:hypothetical protein
MLKIRSGNAIPDLNLKLSPSNCPFDEVAEQDSFEINQPEMNIQALLFASPVNQYWNIHPQKVDFTAIKLPT